MPSPTDVRADRRGLALETTLLLVLLIAVLVIAGFMRVTADRRSSADAAGAISALAVAENGVDRFICANTTGVPTTLPYTTTYDVAGGRAEVRLEQVRPASGNLSAQYLLTSTGTTGRFRYNPLTPRAERTVAQLLQWNEATLMGGAALTTLNGILQAGQPATYDGRNGCAGQPDAPGLQMKDADEFVKTSNSDDPVIYGSSGSDITEMGDLAEAIEVIGFDWGNVVASIAALPTATILTDAQLSSKNYGGFAFPPKSQQPWPIIVVDNVGKAAYAANKAGHGILLVTGDFETSGNAFEWEGLVLIGGTMTVSGNSTWTGSVYAGLNNTDPNNPSVVTDNSLVGMKLFKYNSCSVQNALQSFVGWSKLSGTRVDNVPNY
jgi:hypothetical protein